MRVITFQYGDDPGWVNLFFRVPAIFFDEMLQDAATVQDAAT
jgi:hypothetical protein